MTLKNRTLLINVTVCVLICATIVICEMSFNSRIVNSILLGIYFSIPIAMVVLTVVELLSYHKNPWYIHLVNIVKFDIFFMLAVLSLVVELAKALNISMKIGLNEVVAGLATLVALDRVLIYAKIAFEKKAAKPDTAKNEAE